MTYLLKTKNVNNYFNIIFKNLIIPFVIFVVIYFDFNQFLEDSKSTSFIKQYTPTYIDNLQLEIQLNNNLQYVLSLLLLSFIFLNYLILKLYTNLIFASIGTFLISANNLTYNTLLSAPYWDFYPRLFFLLSLVLIIFFVTFVNNFTKKNKNPIPIILTFLIILFTIIYPVFFIHYRFYSPILVILLITSISYLTIDFNLKIFFIMSSIASTLMIKSPEYLESFFVSGLLKSSLLSKHGYYNSQISLSIVNTDENVQLLIDEKYFKLIEFLGLFSQDIFFKFIYSLNYLLTNNIFFNSKSQDSYIARNIYGKIVLNPTSPVLSIGLISIFLFLIFYYALNVKRIDFKLQFYFILMIYILFTLTFSRYQLNTFFHIQFIFIVTIYLLLKIIFSKNLFKTKYFLILASSITLSIIILSIFNFKLIQKTFLNNVMNQVNSIKFEEFSFDKMPSDESSAILKIKNTPKLFDILLNVELKDYCNSNIIRLKPIYNFSINAGKNSSQINFINEWIAIENTGKNKNAKFFTGILAPSSTANRIITKANLVGFKTFNKDLGCIKNIAFKSLNKDNKKLFSYSFLQSNLKTKLKFKTLDNIEINTKSIRKLSSDYNNIKVYPVRDICDELRTPTFTNAKSTLYSNDIKLKNYLEESKIFFKALELGCPSQGSFFIKTETFYIGKVKRNNYIQIATKPVAGNFIAVLVDISESSIFKNSETISAKSNLIIPSDGIYYLHIIQVIDDQNSLIYEIPKLDVELIKGTIFQKNELRLLPKF
jgi:hypothetical protein